METEEIIEFLDSSMAMLRDVRDDFEKNKVPTASFSLGALGQHLHEIKLKLKLRAQDGRENQENSADE